jgi:hypothetical protein
MPVCGTIWRRFFRGKEERTTRVSGLESRGVLERRRSIEVRVRRSVMQQQCRGCKTVSPQYCTPLHAAARPVWCRASGRLREGRGRFSGVITLLRYVWWRHGLRSRNQVRCFRELRPRG